MLSLIKLFLIIFGRILLFITGVISFVMVFVECFNSRPMIAPVWMGVCVVSFWWRYTLPVVVIEMKKED